MAGDLPGGLAFKAGHGHALVRLWELDQYENAELLRKKFAAMMTRYQIY